MILPIMYTGEGNYLPGVPARDMSKDEWERIDEATRALALRLHLYQIGTVKRAVKWNDRRAKETKDTGTAPE